MKAKNVLKREVKNVRTYLVDRCWLNGSRQLNCYKDHYCYYRKTSFWQDGRFSGPSLVDTFPPTCEIRRLALLHSWLFHKLLHQVNTCSARKGIKRFLFFNTQLFFDTFFPTRKHPVFVWAGTIVCANVKKMRSLLSVLHTSRKQNQCALGAHQQVQKNLFVMDLIPFLLKYTNNYMLQYVHSFAMNEPDINEWKISIVLHD